MRLTELDPRWFAEPGRHGQGVTFRCPHCQDTTRDVYIAVAFANPLDGASPISLTPSTLWPTLSPRPDRSADPMTVPPGAHWTREGDAFATLTITPSVDASKSGHWHGFITTGEIR